MMMLFEDPVNEEEQQQDRPTLEEEDRTDLTPVTKCCLKKKCFEKISPKVQNELFNGFWRIGDYAKQNYFLVGLMAANAPQQKVLLPMKKNKAVSWKYWIDIRGRKIAVCKGFFLAVYGVSDKRLRVLQTKLINGDPLEDQRGRYDKDRRGNQHTVKKQTNIKKQPVNKQNVSAPAAKLNVAKTVAVKKVAKVGSTEEGVYINEIVIPPGYTIINSV